MVRTAVAALMMSAGFAGAQCVADFAYADFSNVSGLSLVGSAGVTAGKLRLTPSQSGQAGAAWYGSKVSVRDGLVVEFACRTSGTADGIAFVIQGESSTALGGGGSGIGYGSNGAPGITRSLAVEIDTFSFPDEFASDHVSIQTDGLFENQVDDSYSLGHAVLGVDVNDGEEHRVRVQYVSGMLVVYVDDMDIPVVQVGVDLDDINGDSILDGNGCAWIGFTAATGAAIADQDILTFSYTNNAGCVALMPDFDHSSIQFNGEYGGRMEQHIAMTGSGPRTYQWKINDVPLVDDGRVQGAQTPHLVIEPLTAAEAGHIQIDIGNECSGVGISWDYRMCGSSDYNGDGDFGTDQDIEAFFACLGGNCCPLCQGSDFNFDGDFGTDQDIEAFFRVLGGGGC